MAATFDALIAEYQSAPDVTAAAEVLERIAAARSQGLELPDDFHLGEAFGDLATAAADEKDVDRALTLQQRAIEVGGTGPTSSPGVDLAYLGWYQLDAGHLEAGRATLAEAVALDPSDLEARSSAAAALEDADPQGALDAYDEALRRAWEAARRQSDPNQTYFSARRISTLQIDREDLRRRMRLPVDDGDRRAIAEQAHARASGSAEVMNVDPAGILWIGRDDIPAALNAWPHLDAETFDVEAYVLSVEFALRARAEIDGIAPRLLAASVAELVAADVPPIAPFSAILDDDEGAEYRRRRALWIREAPPSARISWPPGRNEECWCGSGRKYKRCCGGA